MTATFSPGGASGSHDYFLRSERIGFRLWTVADLPLALGLWGDPLVTRLIDARGHLSEDQVRERLTRELATQHTHGVQYWPSFLLRTGEHLGCCGLRPYNLAKGVYELGVHLCQRHWGQGYATEAARAVMAHAFGPLGVKALFAGHNPRNDSSRRLLGKLGFRYTHDEFYPPTGLHHPSYLLTREEHLAAGAAVTPPRQVVIQVDDPASPEARQLIALLDEYQTALYPAGHVYLLSVEALRQPNVTFLTARARGKVVGCGALVNHGDYAELKRMFVLPEARGMGVGRHLLAELEVCAVTAGLRVARLETGVSQPEALLLYEQAGYKQRGVFGSYPDDPLSIFLEKELG